MSVEAVLSRISQLQAMLDTSSPPAPARPSAQASSASFASALSSATAAGADTSAASTGTDLSATGTAAGATGAGTDFASPAVPLGAPAAPAAGATPATGSGLTAGVPYTSEITAAAQANGLDPALLAGLIKQESGFNPHAGSGAGAQGLTQLMPGTARGLGVTNPFDPAQSIMGGAKYLKAQLDAFGGDVTKALAAYNAGPGAVKRFGGVPPYAETQNYVRAVQANAASFRSSTT
jgi:soluble lytic murein transglycosylase-like protein